MNPNSNPDQSTDPQTPSKPFQLFQPIKKQPSAINFTAQPSELIDLLKKNPAEQQSFKLQPSIINVAAFRDADKPSISDFSTHLHTSGRGRKPNALKKLNDIEKKTTKTIINKFEARKDSETFTKIEIGKKVDVKVEEEEETEIKKQLKAHQFDSEAEDVTDYLPITIDFKADLCFIDRAHLPLINKKISKNSKKLYDLMGFIKKRENETNDVKTYACKYCPKVFVRRAALGGHTAKNHPHQSDSYRIRQESLKNRKIERERFDYFKTIENK